MPTNEVLEHFSRVEDRLVNATDEEKSPSFFQNIAGELLLVINEAGGDYPEAHGRLSEVFLALKDMKRAQQEYQIALQQDPYEVVAWKTRLSIVLIPYAGHTDFRRSSSFEPTTDGVVGSVARNLGSQRYEANVIKEFKKLLETYRQLVTHTANAAVWVDMSDLILQMADYLHQNDLVWHKGSWPNLYEDVANAPWSKIEGQAYDEAIAEIKQTAQGRLLLYPSTSKPSTTSMSSTQPAQRQQSEVSGEITRPKQVTTIVVLAVIEGVISFWLPLGGIIGILTFLFAYGAWTLKSWAWILGIGLQVIYIFSFLATLFSFSYSNIFGQVPTFILSLIVLSYLLRDETKVAFGRT